MNEVEVTSANFGGSLKPLKVFYGSRGNSYILMLSFSNELFPPPPHLLQLNQPGLLTMPRSPTSSEDEMAQSFSDYSDDCASDSSREETIYETIRATAEPSQSRMDDIHTNSLVVRILIPDLQQTVNICGG